MLLKFSFRCSTATVLERYILYQQDSYRDYTAKIHHSFLKAIPVHTCPCRSHCPLERGPPPWLRLRPVVIQNLLFTASHFTLLFQTFCRSDLLWFPPAHLCSIFCEECMLGYSLAQWRKEALPGGRITSGRACERSECPKELLAQWAWMVHRTGSSSQKQRTHKEPNLNSRFLPS